MASQNRTAEQFPGPSVLVGAIVLVAVLVWSYAVPMSQLVWRWWNEPDYLYGFLVPAFSVWVLWYRREDFSGIVLKGSWWGLSLLALCAVMRWASVYFFFILLDPLSIVPCLAGLVLLVGGWQALRWAGPPIAFLVFMVPLPGFVAGLLSHPLQRIGTIVSCYILQTVGIPAIAQGNVIRLTETQLGVVEACSGLRMMMLFFAVCVGAAMVMRTGVLEKIIVVLSAPAIAVLANVIRITTTAILSETLGDAVGKDLEHNVAGFAMMPMAILILGAETWLLSKLLLPPEVHRPLAVGAVFRDEAMRVSAPIVERHEKT